MDSISLSFGGGAFRFFDPSRSLRRVPYDFWGSHGDFKVLAEKFWAQIEWSNADKMSVIGGAVTVHIDQLPFTVRLWDFVSGAGHLDPNAVSQLMGTPFGLVRLLDPVALIGSEMELAKHLFQSGRCDVADVRLSRQVAEAFLETVLSKNILLGLAAIKRWLKIAENRRDAEFSTENKIPLIESIPFDQNQKQAKIQPPRRMNRRRLNEFMRIRGRALDRAPNFD